MSDKEKQPHRMKHKKGIGKAAWRKITSPIICHPDLQQTQLLNGRSFHHMFQLFFFICFMFNLRYYFLIAAHFIAPMTHCIKYHWFNWFSSSLPWILQYSYLPKFYFSFENFLAAFLLYSNWSFWTKTTVKQFDVCGSVHLGNICFYSIPTGCRA
jgi:hypothetical protein